MWLVWIFPSGDLFWSVLPQTYEQWKDSLPDSKWIKDLLPPADKVDAFRASLIDLTAKFRSTLDDIEIGNSTKLGVACESCTFISPPHSFPQIHD